MKVWVFQGPKGALMRSRWPLRERPRRRVIAQARHLGVDGRLVQEHQPVRLLAHARLAVACPDPALIAHIGACALRRHQLFFYT